LIEENNIDKSLVSYPKDLLKFTNKNYSVWRRQFHKGIF